jgi:hypothetical protein
VGAPDVAPAAEVFSAATVATAVIACGALSAPIREIAARRGWDLEVHALPPLLHNRPRAIAPSAEALARRLQAEGRRVVLAYADCGSYGALDDLCARLSIRRLGGLHCYDVYAGAVRMEELFSEDAGTYVLTDFLVRSFRRTVLRELGLDRRPELWGDFFGNYHRVVWLAQHPSAPLESEAREVASMFGLPLTILDVGVAGLERELECLLGEQSAPLPLSVPVAPGTAGALPRGDRGPGCAAG